MKKLLIVYYSQSNGNTEKIAKMLKKAANADIEKIDTVKPYEGSYQDVVSQGKREVNKGFKPVIKPVNFKISDYDIVAVGTPTWWYTMAPAMLTFLSGQNWTGKTVIPFATNGGWPGHVIEDIQKVCKGARTVCEMLVQFDSSGGDHLETSADEINEWIEKVRSL